ncbi:MAG TPA: M20/M25/M40 family metallo-hydrolase [Vicinamibacteria bacterium]|nr:M20/M25/M40 family metallo-hydrolase [Vicinamibacteria bacterium]
MPKHTRREILRAAGASAAALVLPRRARGDAELGPVHAQVERRHDEAVARLQQWIRQPSIAAEDRGMEEGCELMMHLAREAGFQRVERVPTDGQPSVFATLDAGARRSVGLYFMYDVKQVDPAEWSSPPWDAALVDRPGFGKVVMGRGAVNQKGPQSALLAALHAVRGAGRRPPVNLVLLAEGEEEIGSPHFQQVVRRPEVSEALARCTGVFMPSAGQDPDGSAPVSLGAKGVVELELVASGERWGRGPRKDVHSGNRARLDSPAFRLVQALATLVTRDGDPAIDGFADAARPPSPREREMLDAAAARLDEATAKRLVSADRWVHDLPWRASLERLCFAPTVNIEGLVAGYTGPGGKTVLPHRAVAKLDLRLVPAMTYAGAVAALRDHLAKRGFGDVEVNPSGGYDPTSTAEDAAIVRAQLAVYRRAGLDPLLWPRNAGSYPGYVFTGEPLRRPTGHFGLGHGGGAHAPDEYYVIESSIPKVTGYDGAVRSFVDYLYELATVA